MVTFTFFKWCLSSGQLSVTQGYGIVTLLPKGDKPRQFLKSWRPISLLNTSYKIASAIIAERIKSCLPFIINESQKGFMADRFMSKFTHVHTPTTKVEILKNTLWFNDKIKVGGRCIYYRHWESKGVNFGGDLIDKNGNFLTLNAFKNIFNVHTNFLEYCGVLRAIKASFQDITSDYTHINLPFIPFNLEILLMDKKGSQRIYQGIVSSKHVQRKFILKWNAKLNTEYDFPKWSLIFNIPYSCTVDIKLRWFQFRLIHRILGTNSFLFKINKTGSNLCTFCNNEEETLIHLFCSCTHTISFWSSVFSWIKEETNRSINMDNEAFLFGNTNASSKIVNLILFICRFHVYKRKMNRKCPSLLVLKREVRNYCSMEKCMFHSNGDGFKFYQKWDSFLILGQG